MMLLMKRIVLAVSVSTLLIGVIFMINSASTTSALLGDPGHDPSHECPPNCEPNPCPCTNQCSSCGCPCSGSYGGGSHDEYDDSMYMHAPKVEFPTIEQLFEYYYDHGIKKDEFNIISNTSEGSPSDMHAAVIGDTAWGAWLGKVNGTNHVFITVSRDNMKTFEEPIILSPPNGGNATNLQLGVTDSGRFVDLTWEGSVNGTNTIFYSNSMNFGQDFKTYPINLPNEGDASSPVLEVRGESVALLWKQQQSFGNQTGDVLYMHGGHW